ncbi:MAG TPA: hypothetical protein ENI70_00060 [Candidatus Peregrinibacteria bacterium]|nr:hypothetical protein [Candidatus Peregrinibacteria bacterium]
MILKISEITGKKEKQEVIRVDLKDISERGVFQLDVVTADFINENNIRIFVIEIEDCEIFPDISVRTKINDENEMQILECSNVCGCSNECGVKRLNKIIDSNNREIKRVKKESVEKDQKNEGCITARLISGIRKVLSRVVS